MFKHKNRGAQRPPARAGHGPDRAGRTGAAAECPGGHWAAVTRWVTGIIFLVFGVGKFSNHAAELASFRHYPLPAPGAFVYLVGVIEISGGLLLIMGLLTRLAALVLAADMIGAIVISGLARWELVSLTLAPLLLAAMISLIRFGAGSWSLDCRIALTAASGHGPPLGDIRRRLIPGGRPCP